MTTKQYRKVARLIGHLIAETKKDAIVWVDRGPLGFAEATHCGLRYIVENPQDGQPEFHIGETRAWRGYELKELLSVIHEQEKRLKPPQPALSQPVERTDEVDAVVVAALATFAKKGRDDDR